MPISTSPRLRDDLEFAEPEELDPRFAYGFRSTSLGSSDYRDWDTREDHRPHSSSGDLTAFNNRKKNRQREVDIACARLQAFQYPTVADGDLFRVAVLHPGSGTNPVVCDLVWRSSKEPTEDYICLSYCWETTERDSNIICNGCRFAITPNLLSALMNLRQPRSNLYIWIDQICINQDDDAERGHQVSIMEKIFSRAKKVIVWLGEEDEKTRKLCEYVKRMEGGRDSTRGGSRRSLTRIMPPRELQHAIKELLLRPWFQRVWVIPEVALAKRTTVACGRERISWDSVVRLIRDIELPRSGSFDKQTALLGSPRQRIAIITQMAASQQGAHHHRHHTDITQLLILGKGSKATDVRDMIYAFYGLTYLSTFPSYRRPVELLYAEIAHMYVNAIQWDTSYSGPHRLTEEQRTQQLMSILYSAGSLHQHYTLSSWIPDWTFSWHLAPIWCKTISNVVTGSRVDEWSTGIRCDFRAGGETRKDFEVVESPIGMHTLRISVIIFDSVSIIGQAFLESTPAAIKENRTLPDEVLRYGRACFGTSKGYVGIATPGIEVGDDVAVILGGDVPVLLRPCGVHDKKSRAYQLLCECFIQSNAVMHGELVQTEIHNAEDIVLI